MWWCRMCQTGNDIMVRYDTVVAIVASGPSCLSLTLPPTTPTLFFFSLPQVEKEERNNFLNEVFCKWWLPVVREGRLEKDTMLSMLCKLKKNKELKCQNTLQNSLQTGKIRSRRKVLWVLALHSYVLVWQVHFFLLHEQEPSSSAILSWVIY